MITTTNSITCNDIKKDPININKSVNTAKNWQHNKSESGQNTIKIPKHPLNHVQAAEEHVTSAVCLQPAVSLARVVSLP